jgi:molecular chaperone IbpA
MKEKQPMRTTVSLDNYLNDMLRELNRFAVGYEPTLRTLDTLRQNSGQGFPPYDLIKISDSEYRLSMAVAGYSASDLEITEHDGVLTITGKVASDDSRVFLHKGIAGRSFKRSFYLDQYVYVNNSSLENGILTINFVKDVPEALKPRRIVISNVPAIEG